MCLFVSDWLCVQLFASFKFKEHTHTYSERKRNSAHNIIIVWVYFLANVQIAFVAACSPTVRGSDNKLLQLTKRFRTHRTCSEHMGWQNIRKIQLPSGIELCLQFRKRCAKFRECVSGFLSKSRPRIFDMLVFGFGCSSICDRYRILLDRIVGLCVCVCVCLFRSMFTGSVFSTGGVHASQRHACGNVLLSENLCARASQSKCVCVCVFMCERCSAFELHANLCTRR